MVKTVLIKLSVFLFGFLLLGLLSSLKTGVKTGAKVGVKIGGKTSARAVKAMKKTDFPDISLKTNLNQLKRPIIQNTLKESSKVWSDELESDEE